MTVTPLKLRIIHTGRPQYQIAHDAGIDETRLSRIATGRLAATDEERKRLSATLGVRVNELFEDALAPAPTGPSDGSTLGKEPSAVTDRTPPSHIATVVTAKPSRGGK